MSSNVRKYTDDEILNRVRSLPTFKGFPEGILDVWVRSKRDEFDRFDDVVFTYECFGSEKPPVFIMKCSGTTNAGAYGLKQWAKYNSSGCAVLKSDVIVYDSHLFGKHKGYPAYRQAKGFPYFRDADGDSKAEENGREYLDVIYANCHKAGVASTVINNWSVACLVRNNLAEWTRWLKFMAKRPLSVAILKEF